MLHIVATVCLLYSQPHKCKEIVLSFAEEVSPIMACMSVGPLVELAKWHESNPNWYVKRYKCTAKLPDQEV